MPNEVFVFAAITSLFLVLATLVTTLLWRWKASPLPSSLAPAPRLLRVQRLFHGSAGAEPSSRSAGGRK